MKGWELGGRLVVLLHWRILRIRIMHCEVEGGVRGRQEGIRRRTHLDHLNADFGARFRWCALNCWSSGPFNARWFIDEKKHQGRSSSLAGLTLG